MKYSLGFQKKRQVWCQMLVLQTMERKGQLAFNHKIPDQVRATLPPKKPPSFCGLFSDNMLLDGRSVNAHLPPFLPFLLKIKHNECVQMHLEDITIIIFDRHTNYYYYESYFLLILLLPLLTYLSFVFTDIAFLEA